MDKMFEKWGGGEVLRRAVRGMLPKNRLREPRLARLKSLSSFSDACHYVVWYDANFFFSVIAFEGVSHPYKENIIKLGHQPSVIGSMPEVQQALKEAKTSA